jgi:hypothetical protein
VTTNEVGSATASFKVPESAGGVYTIRAVGETSGVSASVDFTVNQSIATTPTSGKVGATVEVRVRGFEPNTSISVRWQEVNRPLATLHTATTSDKGSLTFSFVVPEATNGKHTMRAVSASGIRAFADFRVAPTVIMAPDEGPAGTEIALAMTGYGPGEQVDIRWYDAVQSSYVITSVTATDLGSATASFSAPNAKTGSHKVEAVGLVSGAKGSDYFYTRAGISLAPGNGPTGTTVTATMSGYKDGETITIRWYRTTYQYTAITTTTANPDGTATATFDVPSDATLGSHKVEAVSASYIRATTAFVVE